jgi:hypothetical protein
VDALAHVRLNDQALGEVIASDSARFDITDRLAPRNVLVIEIEKPCRTMEQCGNSSFRENMAGGLIGEVRLEIEEPGHG